jgi:AraC-like DNA-binding protein
VDGHELVGAGALPSPGGAGAFHFSSDAWPEHCRVQLWREVFGERMLGVELDPIPGERLRSQWCLRALPGAGIVWANNSPLRLSFPKHLCAGSGDTIGFQWAASLRSGKLLCRDFTVDREDGVLLSGCDPFTMTIPGGGPLIGVSFAREALGPLLRDKNLRFPLTLSRNSGALRLLIRYLEILRDETEATPELQHLTVSHICDLLALALGATRDAAETAKGRGVRAARLQAIKSEILENLDDERLSAAEIASRHHLTPRQIQLLFSGEGTTFTDFVREQRLARAHRMLSTTRYDDKPISDVAFACGFGDLSYFSRSFRARYRATPSDVRNMKRDSADGAAAARGSGSRA